MLTKVGKILAIITSAAVAIGAVGRAYLDDHQIATNQAAIIQHDVRIQSLEQDRHDDHYMICYLYQKAQKDGVPASCNTALRATN